MGKKKSHKCSWCEPAYYKMNIHHRLPRSRGGVSDDDNLSVVPVILHEAYNLLFGSNPTAEEVVKVLSDIWIDPKYEIVLKLKDH